MPPRVGHVVNDRVPRVPQVSRFAMIAVRTGRSTACANEASEARPMTVACVLVLRFWEPLARPSAPLPGSEGTLNGGACHP